MAILYSYPKITPKLEDLLIGTDMTEGGDKPTRSFSVQDVLNLVIPVSGAQNLQQVTTVGATTDKAITTTNSITLTGATTGNLSVAGYIKDSTGAAGTAGQVLSSTVTGTLWTADAAGVTSFTNANGTFISAGTVNTNATGIVTVGTIDLSATGTKDATTFLRGDNTWSVPVGAVTSVTTTDGTYIDLTPNAPATGAVTVTADLNAVDGTAVALTRFLSKDNTWDVPAYTVEADTLQTVCTRGSTTSTSITMTGSGAAGYLYVTGNAGTSNPTHTQGLAFAYNNSGGSRENEVFWNTGTTTVSNNNASYLGFWNEFLNSDAGDARVSSLQLKLYGTGELGLNGVTPTISNTYWRMPTSAAGNTGYYLAKDAASINLIWTEPSVSILNHSGVPASASATGTAGTMRWDADYIYVCTATDTWKRVGIATW